MYNSNRTTKNWKGELNGRRAEMIENVTFIWLYVSDLERSIRFFGENLGLPLQNRWHEGACFAAGNLTIGVHIKEEPIVCGGSPVITFNVSGRIEDLWESFQKRGVIFSGGVS